MACKHIIVSFFFLNVILYSAAEKLTESDLELLKSAWMKLDKNPVEYAKALVVRLIDEVAVPIATETLDLLAFILTEDSIKKIVNMISQAKTFTKLPQFPEYVTAITDIITKSFIPNLKEFGHVFNEPEEFMTKNAELIMDIGLHIYHSNLERAKPVLDDFMSKDWTAEEIGAVDKVIALLEEVDKDMIKRTIASIN